MVQLFTAWPSTCTTQAPHWLVSQPTCVPVSRRSSRAETEPEACAARPPAVTALPFTVIEIVAMPSSTDASPRGPVRRGATTSLGRSDAAKNRDVPGRMTQVDHCRNFEGFQFGTPGKRGQATWIRKHPNLRRFARISDSCGFRLQELAAGRPLRLRPAPSPPRSRRRRAKLKRRRGQDVVRPPAAAHGLGEVGEELVRHLLGDAIDEPPAELGQLAADLGLHVVIQLGRAAVGVFELHHGAALGETRHAALALADDPVAVRRIDIGERDFSLEGGAHRPDLDLGGGGEPVVARRLEALASGNAGAQHVRIVQLGPHRRLVGRQHEFAGHGHRHGVPPKSDSAGGRPASGACAGATHPC